MVQYITQVTQTECDSRTCLHSAWLSDAVTKKISNILKRVQLRFYTQMPSQKSKWKEQQCNQIMYQICSNRYCINNWPKSHVAVLYNTWGLNWLWYEWQHFKAHFKVYLTQMHLHWRLRLLKDFNRTDRYIWRP